MGKIKIQINGTEIDFSKQRGYFFQMDCMKALKEMPDKCIDLCIVDPPYGGVTKGGYMTNPHTCDKLAKAVDYHLSLWSMDRPPKEYFVELRRISKNQIIWGGNYYASELPDSQCWLVWNKENGDNHFADCELAWTSFNSAVRKFDFRWAGMLQGDMKNKEIRCHPSQKPVALYKWILDKYAHKGDIILDTHVGSASSLIACDQMGYNYIGFEIDEVYYRKAKERLERETAQITIFDFMETNEIAGQMTIFDLMGGTE